MLESRDVDEIKWNLNNIQQLVNKQENKYLLEFIKIHDFMAYKEI